MSKEKVYTIGRSRKCDLILADDRVGRRHAEIVDSPEGIFIRDAGSTNGTFLKKGNEFREVSKGTKVRISTTDVVRFGPCEMTVKELLEHIRIQQRPPEDRDQPKQRVQAKKLIQCWNCGAPKVPGDVCPKCGERTEQP